MRRTSVESFSKSELKARHSSEKVLVAELALKSALDCCDAIFDACNRLVLEPDQILRVDWENVGFVEL
jgi:hypothetical protein